MSLDIRSISPSEATLPEYWVLGPLNISTDGSPAALKLSVLLPAEVIRAVAEAPEKLCRDRCGYLERQANLSPGSESRTLGRWSTDLCMIMPGDVSFCRRRATTGKRIHFTVGTGKGTLAQPHTMVVSHAHPQSSTCVIDRAHIEWHHWCPLCAYTTKLPIATLPPSIGPSLPRACSQRPWPMRNGLPQTSRSKVKQRRCVSIIGLAPRASFPRNFPSSSGPRARFVESQRPCRPAVGLGT